MSRLKLWTSNATSLTGRTPDEFKTNRAFCAVLSLIHIKNWSGACHASTGVLVALLRAQGVEAEPYLGECLAGKHHFDHSWVEVGGEIYDAAISNSLIEGFFSPPEVIRDEPRFPQSMVCP